jgi:hypothetical protein
MVQGSSTWQGRLTASASSDSAGRPLRTIESSSSSCGAGREGCGEGGGAVWGLVGWIEQQVW